MNTKQAATYLLLSYFSSNALSMDINTEVLTCEGIRSEVTDKSSFLEDAKTYQKEEQCYKEIKFKLLTTPSTQNEKSVLKTVADNTGKLTLNLLKTMEEKQADASGKSESSMGQANFFGQNKFGGGLAIVMYDKEIIDDAVIVDNKVQAKSYKRNEAKFMLEFHTMLKPDNKNADRGHGLFASILVGGENNDVLDGVGLGWLYSIKDPTKNDGSGFSFGIGAVLENNVTQLAKGFKVGAELPAGETEIRYIDKDEVSPFIFITNNF